MDILNPYGNLPYTKTVSFGQTYQNPKLGRTTHSWGADYDVTTGENNPALYAPVSGKVSLIKNDGGWGNRVYIEGDDGYKYWLSHLAEYNPDLQDGMKINAGTYLGKEGTTGNSTGTHLDFSIKDSQGNYVDPSSFNWTDFNPEEYQMTNKLAGAIQTSAAPSNTQRTLLEYIIRGPERAEAARQRLAKQVQYYEPEYQAVEQAAADLRGSRKQTYASPTYRNLRPSLRAAIADSATGRARSRYNVARDVLQEKKGRVEDLLQTEMMRDESAMNALGMLSDIEEKEKARDWQEYTFEQEMDLRRQQLYQNLQSEAAKIAQSEQEKQDLNDALSAYVAVQTIPSSISGLFTDAQAERILAEKNLPDRDLVEKVLDNPELAPEQYNQLVAQYRQTYPNDPIASRQEWVDKVKMQWIGNDDVMDLFSTYDKEFVAAPEQELSLTERENTIVNQLYSELLPMVGSLRSQGELAERINQVMQKYQGQIANTQANSTKIYNQLLGIFEEQIGRR